MKGQADKYGFADVPAYMEAMKAMSDGEIGAVLGAPQEGYGLPHGRPDGRVCPGCPGSVVEARLWSMGKPRQHGLPGPG